MERDDRRALEDAVALIAATSNRMSFSLTRTKLVKLLYFVDLRAWERSGRVITGVDWMWHHYGPYSAEIVATCRQMAASGELTERATSNYYGSAEYRIMSVSERYFDPPPVGVVELVREVVAEFGPLSPSQIGDKSYETIPLRRLIETGGSRGDLIEFPSAPPTTAAVARTTAKYAAKLRGKPQRHDEGDVAAGLLEDVDALEHARKSGTRRQLIG